MASYDPIWLAMVLGAQAHIRPPAHVIIDHGDHDPESAYVELKKAIGEGRPIDVDILDVGPGSSERRQQLADGLEQNEVGADPAVQKWAGIVLKTVLRYRPGAIDAAGFSEEDVRETLQSLSKEE